MATPWMGKRILEIGGILIILLSLLIFLSLYTYSPLDPSLNSSGISPEFPIQNRVGAVGGYVSDFLLQAIGYSSFLLPLIGILIGARFILHLKISNFLFRLIGFIFILLTISTMIRIIRPDLRYENLLGGGVFGEKAGAFLLAKFGIQGGLLICAALILISSLLMLQLFLIEMVKRAWLALTGRFNDLSSAMGSKYRKKVQEHEREQLRREMLEKHRAHREATPTSIPVESSSSEPSESELPARNAPPITKGGIGPRRAIQEELPFPELRKISGFKLPPLTLLDNPPKGNAIDEKEIQAKARLIESKFAEFGIEGAVCAMHPGPVITIYEYQPSAGVKFSRVQGMSDDLSLALKAESVRIDKIPGQSTVGLEVPNAKREMIYLREILNSVHFNTSHSMLSLALGKDATGEPFVADLARMPHLLIAGATGMGKSVSLHAMICSILYKSTPEDVRLILIDPKRVELGVYADIPHLYCEVIVEPKKAVTALKNAKAEMDKRYRTLVRFSARNIDQYNQKVHRRDFTLAAGEEPPAPLPYLVIIIDELADLMAELSGEVEHQIGRLAQMARAVGIHLILATQRPSVDIITGTIKNNLPARISFRVTQKIDSRTILDASGADQLLGNGDMLFMAPGTSRLKRIHGAYVSEEEVMRIITHLKREGKPDYNQAFLKEQDKEEGALTGEMQDELFRQAVELVLSSGQASASHLQRRLKLGYNRAARLIDIMEEQGIVGPPAGPNKSREILVKPDFLDNISPSKSAED